MRRLAAAGFRGLARLRGARAFHPRGLWLRGEAALLPGGPLPGAGGSRPVTARLSKGAGLPGAGPDVLGLAVRLPAGGGLDGPWDLALSSCGIGTATRCLPLPAADWGRARYGSLLPYRVAGQLVWLLAVPYGGPAGPAATGCLERRVRERPWRLALLARPARGGWLPAARLTLHAVLSAGEAGRTSFDPVLNRPAGWEPVPGWLAGLRESAYRGSRSGRRAPRDPAGRPGRR